MKDHRMCELCDQRAALYCASDSAFLCLRCDSRVHGANFLVARHVRQPLCSNCKELAADPFSGGDTVPTDHWLCSSCSPEDDDSFSSSSSLDSACSACVSSTESSAETATTTTTTTTAKVCLRRSGSSVTDVSGKDSYVPARFTARFRKMRSAPSDARAEGTFVNWCKKLGMSSGDSAVVVSSASHALRFCSARLPGVPLRVSLAASFWFGVRLGGDRVASTCKNLRRVEEISGVPAKLILAVDAKLVRELRVRRSLRSGRAELEEGWAEC